MARANVLLSGSMAAAHGPDIQIEMPLLGCTVGELPVALRKQVARLGPTLDDPRICIAIDLKIANDDQRVSPARR